jgi:hypothetical protein
MSCVHEDSTVCEHCHPRAVIEKYETVLAHLRRQLEDQRIRAEAAEASDDETLAMYRRARRREEDTECRHNETLMEAARQASELRAEIERLRSQLPSKEEVAAVRSVLQQSETYLILPGQPTVEAWLARQEKA